MVFVENPQDPRLVPQLYPPASALLLGPSFGRDAAVENVYTKASFVGFAILPTMVRRALFLSLIVMLWCGIGATKPARVRKHRGHKASRTTEHVQSPGRHHHRWRHIFWNPVFRPSHDSLLKQNAEIDRLELPRIQDDAELEQLKLDGKLVPIIPGETLRIDPRLDPDRRYCRPWTREFVEDLADAYHQQFGAQIQVNSAVRTVVVQKKLRRHNRNAAPAEGEIASSHLAGVTVDLQRRGMSKKQIHWVEDYLVPLKAAGLVEPEEERRQWVFHIMVSDRYSEWRDKSELAQRRMDEFQASEVQTEGQTAPGAVIELSPSGPATSLMAPRPVVPGALAPQPETPEPAVSQDVAPVAASPDTQ